MGATFGESRADQTGGVNLTQLSDLVERGTQECLTKGIDPATVEPKVQISLGGKIKKITVETP